LQKAARHYELAIEVIMPLFVSDAENANLSGIFKGARRGIQVYESLNISNMSLKAMELSFRRQVLSCNSQEDCNLNSYYKPIRNGELGFFLEFKSDYITIDKTTIPDAWRVFEMFYSAINTGKQGTDRAI
jgi:hypothetical protein